MKSGEPLVSPTSMNNRLVLVAYKNEGQLKATVHHGIAMVSQKVSVKGLAVLINAHLSDGTLVKAGDKAYIKEEHLHTQPWAKRVFESDALPCQFIIVDLAHVEFIVPTAVPSARPSPLPVSSSGEK